MNEILNPYQTLSITSFGPSTIDQGKTNTFTIKATNNVNDIEGAQYTSKHSKYLQKPQFLQSDVLGSTSKSLTRERNVRDNSLYIDDIDGTRHTIKDRMMRTSRHVDPLNPTYPLPSFNQDVSVTTRFIKDPQAHEDIEGSNVKPKRVFDVRDTLSVADIEGAQADWRPRHTAARLKSDPHEVMFNGVDERLKFSKRTQRHTDPCNPVYQINGTEYASDKHSRPRMPKAYIAESNNLRTDDITGAMSASAATKDKFVRVEFRNTNFIGDIEGAQADSTKHSMVTTRQTNPLTPVYRGLDPGEMLEPLIPSLIPPTMVLLPTIPLKVKTVPQTQQHEHRLSRPPMTKGGTIKGTGDGTGRIPSVSPAVSGTHFDRGDNTLALNFSSIVARTSPAQSARSNCLISSTPNSAQRRMVEQRQEEINLVRQLQL